MRTLVRILGLAVAVAGIVLSIIFLFVGGIEEIVSGAQANPAIVSDIVWGAVKLLLTGTGIWASVVLGGIIAAAG